MMPMAYWMLHGGVVQTWTGLEGIGAPKRRRKGDRIVSDEGLRHDASWFIW